LNVCVLNAVPAQVTEGGLFLTFKSFLKRKIYQRSTKSFIKVCSILSKTFFKEIQMAKNNKIRLPSSEGGIVQYYDSEYPSKIMLHPSHVLIFITIICILGLVVAFIL